MISEIIKNRRAVFPVQYNEQPISKEEITRVLEAANWAPTHKRTEPWRFKVFRGNTKMELGNFMADKYKETAEKFSETKYRNLTDKFSKAQCVIAICFQRNLKESLPEWEEVAATAMAVQNMWLVATQMKIGAYWSSPGTIRDLGQHIDLQEGEHCLGLFYMGKYDGKLPEGTRRTSIAEKTEWM